MILVSGATGLVGSHLLVELLKKNAQVKAIYRSEKSKEKTRKVFAFHNATHLLENILWQKADITDYYSLKDCFVDVTHVYHAAALVSFNEQRSEEMMEVNVTGTMNMVNLCLEFGIEKMCYVSSVAALGEYSNRKCADEAANWQFSKYTSSYTVSKFYGENEVWRGAAEGLNVVIVNPSTILGYGDWEESSLIIIQKVAKGLKFYPPGTNGFVGVNDVVKASMLLMESAIVNERYVISSENLSFQNLFQTIAKAFNQKAPSIKVSRKLTEVFVIFDRLRTVLFGLPRVLPASNLNSIFNQRCFSAAKFEKEFKVKFQSIDSVVEELVPAFQQEFRLS